MRPRLARLLCWAIGTLAVSMLMAQTAHAETPAPAAPTAGEQVLGWWMVVLGGLATVGAIAYMYVKKRSMPPPLDGGLSGPKRR